MADLQETYRVLVVERHEDVMDSLTRTLERDGYIVTGTLSDAIALDLVRSSSFHAVVIGDGVSHSDRRHLVAQIQSQQPSTLAIAGHGPESVLIQLRQAYKEKASSEAT